MIKKKFGDAFRGMADGFRHRSIVVQWILAAMAVTAGMIMKLTYTEWLAVILCIGLVITAEILNTCIEKICDFCTLEQNEQIRTIKDLGAGAVLCASLTALICALVILVRHLSGG